MARWFARGLDAAGFKRIKADSVPGCETDKSKTGVEKFIAMKVDCNAAYV